MDTRSPSGKVAFSDFRLVLNMDGWEERGYCRLGGWQPYLKDSEFGFKNQDLHDQMLAGQYYSNSYQYSYPATQTPAGFQYPVFYPSHYVPDYSLPGPTLGPFCGYPFDVPYLMEEVVDQRFVTAWHVGYPYTHVLDAQCIANGGGGGPGPPPPPVGDFINWTVQVRGTDFTVNHSHVVAATLYWKSALFGNGNSTKSQTDFPPPATHVFTWCLPPDATDVVVDVIAGIPIDGPTKGTVVCTAGTTASEQDASGKAPAPCVTSDCYEKSWYFLGYNYGYDGYLLPPYYGGEPIPIYNTVPASTSTICYDEKNLLGNQCPEAITGLFSMNSVGGRRRVIATTRSRIYVNDDRAGNWRIIADGLGGTCDNEEDCTCSPKRIKVASTGNSVLFANGIDPVIVWTFDEGPSGCFFWSADYVAELRQLEINTARVVQTWRGFAFIADVTEVGQRFTSRLYWSDYNAPTSWTPGGESLAGRHDFGSGETILAIEPIGGRLRIYTDKAIYDAVLVQDPERVFAFQEIYRDENGGYGLLKYPNTLVNTGDSHTWLGEASMFELTESQRTPNRVAWAHRACAVIFEGLKAEWVQDFDGLAPFGRINANNCQNAVGGWDSARKAVWFSWPTGDNQCPNMSLVLWPRYQKSSIVDHGFTAFAMHKPQFSPSVRDFMVENNICNPYDLVVNKEGLPYDMTGNASYSMLYNATETPGLPMDPNSAIASLCGICFEDLCERCEVNQRLLMASAEDKTIKEFTPDQFLRQMMVSQTPATFPETSVATYEDRGFYSMVQSDGSDYTTPSEKLINAVAVSFNSVEQIEPNDLFCQVGFGASGAECLSWQGSDPLPIECLDGPDFDAKTNERPGTLPRFAFYTRGTWLAWRLFTSGVGGSFCLSSVTLSVRRVAGTW